MIGYCELGAVPFPPLTSAYTRPFEGPQFYSVSKKRHGVSTKTERESQDLSDIILSICKMDDQWG
jgi:hypothetical protein